MVLEQIISTQWLQKKPIYAVYMGFIYTFLGAITGFVFFKDSFSTSLLFLITLLLVPSLVSLINIEEERERREGIKHFFLNHRDIFTIYLFISIGIFLGYFCVTVLMSLSGISFDLTLKEQLKVLGEGITKSQIKNFSVHQFYHALNIFVKNIGVAVIFFVLSFFYGVGSIFLVVWNASVFSTFVYTALRNISRGVDHSIALIGAFSVYMIPEVAGFLLAAIAGGVISKATVREKFMSPSFKNVVRDGIILLVLAFIVLFGAALLEAYIGVDMIKRLV